VSRKGDLVYFTGCLPYFDPIFRDLNVNCTDIARSTVRILNKAGIKPVVLEDERCCGHDLLWSGEDEAMVQDLARTNLGALKEAGAKKVVMSCPECYRTFVKDYPEFVSGRSLDFEVLHTSELFAELIEDGELVLDGKIADNIVPVTFQDPCRLGRQLGVFDQPRAVLRSLPGVELHEMDQNRGNAICCGTAAWMNCGTLSKRIQMDRLREAAATEASTLITACPKCMIHFNCTLSEPTCPDLPTKPDIVVKDLSSLVAEVMGPRRESG
jgi:Fe-S oxidoreductase